MSELVSGSTPRVLREQAEELRQRAQDAFHEARASGQAPDKSLILSYTRQSKDLERQALEVEDQSHSPLSPLDESHASSEQIRIWKDQSLISKVEDGLFISGYDALLDSDCLQSAGITHIFSTCRYHLPNPQQQNDFTCLAIPVLDTADENMLQYFHHSIAFICEAQSQKGRVLVHCHAGHSRSATIVAAYFMQRDKISTHAALQIIRRVRRVQPNENFLNQLRLFHDCDFSISNDSALYRRWKFENTFQAVADNQQALNPSNMPVKYQENDVDSKHTQLRCKKCRFILASENHILFHEPKTTNEFQPESQQSSLLPATCAHFFLEPIRWMKTELDKGELEGRFTCPNGKCGAKLGSYAWQGMTCSCRRWILPALCIQRGKVDELRSKTPAKIEPARRSK